jgi:hypothetical protein
MLRELSALRAEGRTVWVTKMSLPVRRLVQITGVQDLVTAH